jgi:dTDP-4-dehydrorhamnose reductase
MSTPLDRSVTPTQLFCFGFGYCASALAARLGAAHIVGTQRAPGGPVVGNTRLLSFDGTMRSPLVAEQLAGSTHVLLSVPPDADGDPVLRWHGADLAALASLRWVGYLSTVGVYGDADGAWVDETTPPLPASERGRRRLAAERQWQAFGKANRKRVEIFRLPGIYGPGRSAIEAVRAGTARRLVKPNQVFNRIHVADIAAALDRAMEFATADIALPFDTFNLTDDEPAPPQDVVAYAAKLLGVPPPPEQDFDTAVLTPMARSFYGESKRVSNARLKTCLDLTLRYPNYREGLAGCVSV